MIFIQVMCKKIPGMTPFFWQRDTIINMLAIFQGCHHTLSPRVSLVSRFRFVLLYYSKPHKELINLAGSTAEAHT